MLELARGGKVKALNAAVERARGDVLAFSDANSLWDRDALRRLVARFDDPRVGYVCGQVSFDDAAGDNQEGLYWRYEMAVRELESRLAGVTGGNGAINAVRRDAYLFLPSERGQDITFPFRITKHGRRAVYEPRARARERMAATIGDEFGRKRRMMAGAWGTMLTGGMLSPRGYGPLYALADRLAPPAALRVAAASPGRAGGEPGAARRGARVRRHAGRPARAARCGGARAAGPAATAADRALLRRDARRQRRRALGLRCAAACR